MNPQRLPHGRPRHAEARRELPVPAGAGRRPRADRPRSPPPGGRGSPKARRRSTGLMKAGRSPVCGALANRPRCGLTPLVQPYTFAHNEVGPLATRARALGAGRGGAVRRPPAGAQAGVRDDVRPRPRTRLHGQSTSPREPDGEGLPGEFPYTRGPYPTMYRGPSLTMRQIAGSRRARGHQQRASFLIAQGQTGLSVDFDMPTLMGVDSDDPLASAKWGVRGSLLTRSRTCELFDGIDLGRSRCR